MFLEYAKSSKQKKGSAAKVNGTSSELIWIEVLELSLFFVKTELMNQIEFYSLSEVLQSAHVQNTNGVSQLSYQAAMQRT